MITLILGGARSGKSTFAERIARAEPDVPVMYIATAEAGDDEMASRIEIHRAGRPAGWRTWEGDPADIPSFIASSEGVLLLDCLTMYLSRAFFSSLASEHGDEDEWTRAEEKILADVGKIFDACPATTHLIVVSNELGWGVVPATRLSRRFRDMQGRANRLAGTRANNVALVVAGIPLWIKGGLDA
ncbi:bifunctional adenosylcobinamide kinase/adenosylcobinamide-phosphate guanylyltransferase [Synergistaceae bacterium OttesenSCG-928-I11]|nr:bifunctional adenosylcobinamide kinase/adenosylcobinamide-phosphate guanylyltransferase [Synergistaceae bacterium OttesenSCG-928-I11]